MNDTRLHLLDNLPDDLERVPPGPELAALLAPIDRGGLTPSDRVRLAQARNRLASHVQAELIADLCAVSEDEPAD